ncbi:MAG: L-threonylcarbamoyladenylate synthase [Phycisphaerae bacterium]
MVIGETQIAGGPDAIDMAALYLQRGEVVAVPTETVYGLAADAQNQDAVVKIFQAKNRPANNPLITHVLSAAHAAHLTGSWPKSARILASAFWPGPLTLILPSAEKLAPAVSAGLPTVGIRVPAHPIMRTILEKSERPLAAPSANTSGHVSPTTAEHVLTDLRGRIKLIVDGGSCAVGIESTVVGFEDEQPVIYRPGIITAEDIQGALGLAGISTPVRHHVAQGSEQPLPSPGLLSRHYAPHRPTHLFMRSDVAHLESMLGSRLTRSGRPGVISFGPLPRTPDNASWIMLPEDLYHAAGELYRAMRSLDRDDISAILIELPGTRQLSIRSGDASEINDVIPRLSGMARVLADRLMRASMPWPEAHR